jgi:hypothetical protein
MPPGLIKKTSACAPGAPTSEISAKWRALASLSQEGKNEPGTFSLGGQMVPKM